MSKKHVRLLDFSFFSFIIFKNHIITVCNKVFLSRNSLLTWKIRSQIFSKERNINLNFILNFIKYDENV